MFDIIRHGLSSSSHMTIADPEKSYLTTALGIPTGDDDALVTANPTLHARG